METVSLQSNATDLGTEDHPSDCISLSVAEFEALTSDVCGKGNFDKIIAPKLEEKRFGIEDPRPCGVEETWGKCVVYTRWTNPLLLSRKNSEISVLCLALVAIVSHGAAMSMLQVFCPFASSSLMSNAKPRARSGVVFGRPDFVESLHFHLYYSGYIRTSWSACEQG